MILGLGPLGMMYILPSVIDSLTLLTDSNIIENVSRQESTLQLLKLSRDFLPIISLVFFVI